MNAKLYRFLMFFCLIITVLACNKTANPSKMSDNGKLLRHVVIFKFKDTSSPADVQKVADTFADLKKQIPQVADFEWGINLSLIHI